MTLGRDIVPGMKRTLIALVAGLALLAGCAGTSGEATSDAPAGTNSDKSSTQAEEPEEAEETEEPAAPNPKFGEAFTWKDGLSLTVSAPKPFKPSEYSTVDGAKGYVVFEVRLVNKTGKPYDPALLYATLQSGNAEAEAVYDSEKLGESPSTKVLDGREVKYKLAFAVDDPADLVLEISPDAGLEYEGAIFTS